MNPEFSKTQSEAAELYAATDVGAEVGESAMAIKQLTLETRPPSSFAASCQKA